MEPRDTTSNKRRPTPIARGRVLTVIAVDGYRLALRREDGALSVLLAGG